MSAFEKRRPRPKRRFFQPRNCRFCADRKIVINYKGVDVLRQFVHEDGKIRPRRQTGNCAKHQRAITKAIKRARHIALLPFVGEVLR
ncbi:MAG: 30S ribosomal protein S18 [Anaerolineales bacterium]|nr:30S ribosomal protein S18 [Anaerolineales bacterium]